MTTGVPPATHRSSRFSVLTVVAAATLLVSLIARCEPTVMQALVRNRPQLLAGEWWRAVTPVLVQPDGWGQLGFNLLGIVLVGVAVRRQVGIGTWLSAYLIGGVGSIAIYSAWHPSDTGGGSSAAVAALIGLLVATARRCSRPSRSTEFAHWYAIFFCAYLSALDLGGVTASVVAGNLALVLMGIGRRALGPARIEAISGPFVLVAGVTMTVLRDDHGTGLLIGLVIGALALWRGQGRRRPLIAGSRVGP